MPSQGSVTIDVRAQITGYEASLKQLKNEMSKIDPGSAIGKKLSKEIEAAGNQLKALSKNLSPKATSDTQIDNIVDKTNLLGESIQHIARLMQSVSAKDLNFDAFGDGISNFRKEIAGLEEDLQTRLNAGIRETISSSDQLKEVFENILNIKIDGKSSEELFQALTNGANKAEEELKELDAKIEETNNKISRRRARQEKLEESSFGTALGRDQLLEETRGFEKEYQNIFNDLKNKVTENLKNVIGDNTSIDQQKLLDSFFGGLTPQNIKEHIKNLYASLESEGIYKDQKTKFYNDIFGFDGNINSVAKQINLEDPQPIIDKFKNFIEQIAEHIGGKNEAVLTELIGKNEIENATAATMVYINQAYNKVQNEIRKKKTEISELTGELGAQTTQRAAVNDTKVTIEAANAALEARLKELENNNASLRTEIENLKQQIAAKEQANVSSVRNTGAKAGIDAGQFRISADMANQYKYALEQVRAREQLVGKIQGVVQRWFSVYAAVRMVSNAIRSVISTIKELDKTITEIAIVTDMTQEDLWGQMQSYTEMARSYASSISGVYKVSQLYYQQGLQTADVMALTEQTLKMARISGLDYAEATNYMTNAVRSFKMEMTDAQRVVDVYSAISAASATNTTELAEAMSKTASSAEAVGSSFENTTAMMAVMIEATRESASNIGSAMKSIISRYGEMTSDPSKLVDSEGQEMSLNKVDKALQSVGISIHDAAGQFRNFDEVIMELAESWDTIDKNTQRYIATVMAGNRQQSRFLALVSSYDRLKELSATAADSEDASQMQFLKTLDSVDAKLQQLQTSMQSLYVDSGLEKAYKGLLDLGNNVIKTFTQMPKVFNLPILAITKFGASFFSLAKIVTTAFGLIKTRIQHSASELTLINKVAEGERLTESEEAAFRTIINEENKYKELARVVREGQQNIIAEERMGSRQREEIAQEEANNALQLAARRDQGRINKYRTAGMVVSSIGMLGSLIAGNIDVNQNKNLKGALTLGSSLTSGLGTMMMMGGPNPVGIISGIVTALPGVIEAIGQFYETAEERALRFKQAAEEANNAFIQKKADYQDLNDLIKQYEKLEKTQYDSEEARKEFYEVGNQLAEKYPELLQAFDSEGNALINVADSYLLLADAREKAKEAAQDAASTSTAQTENAVKEAENNRKKAKAKILSAKWDKKYEPIGKAYQYSAGDMHNKLNKYGENFIGPLNFDFGVVDSLLLRLQYGLFGDALELLDDENLQNSLKILRESTDENLKEIINFIDSYTAGLASVDADIEKKRATNKNQERASLAKIIGISNSEQLDIARSGGKDSVLEELSGADILISNYIYSRFEEYKKDLQKNPSKRKEDKTILQQFNEEQYEEVYVQAYQLLEDIYSSITSPEDRKKVEEIIKNRSKYTQKQLIDAINNIIGPEGFDELLPAVEELYTGVFDETKFKEAIKGMEDTLSITSFDPSLFGSSELQKIFEVYKNIYQGIKNGQFDSKVGQKILNNYLGILSYTNTLDETSRELAQNLLLNANIFTLNGIYDLKQAISESNLPQDIINLILDSLISSIPINLPTEFSTFAQENVKKLEDFDKALSSAAKGMELDDAIAMADKLKISINDFDFKNGKYFYSNAEKIKESYLNYNQELLNDLNERFIDVKTEYDTKIQEATGDERAKLQAELDEIKESHSRASEKITEYTEYQVNTFLLQNGFIEEFVKSVAGENADIESLMRKILNGDISNLPSEFSNYVNEIYNLLNNVNEEIFSSILNSIKSGKYITSNATNRDKLKELEDKKLLERVGEAAGEIIYKVVAGVTEGQLIDVMGDSVDVESRIKAHNQEFSNTVPMLLSSIINSLDKIDYSTIEYLKEKLHLTDKDIQQYFKYDEQTGNYSTTINNIQRLISDERLEFSEAVSKTFEDDFAKIADYYLDSISKASGYTTKGTTKFADITDFTQIYNELNKTNLASSDLFIWNDLLDTFTLKPEYLNDYLELQKQQLEQLGYSSEWAEGYINSQIKQIRNNVDFNSFISAENNTVGSDARKTLENQLTNYLSLEDPEYQKKLAEINLKKAEREHQKEFWSSLNVNSETLAWVLELYDSSIADLEADLKQSEETIITIAQEDIDILSKGGTTAVDTLKKYKPKATAKEIEAIYRAAIAPLEDAQAQLEYGVGSLVSGAAIDILKAAGYKIDNNGVIKSIGDLNKAYSNYYQKLKDTNGATTAAINAAYAKVLETSDGEQVIIDALSDAANMTYTRLGDILASAGKRLDDEFNNVSQYIESIGGNKIRIKDFAGFANYMGWKENSEEYWSAFKTYNDAMVELNRKAEHNIMEELQNALNAQQGDWVNLTQLTSKIPEELLNQIISGTGAVIEDGILKLDAGASTNIAEIVNRILEITSSSGLLLDNEVNELKDAIQNLLNTYINLFKNGISGSLSNTDAGKLQNWASTLNSDLKLDFTRTTEGLKLSNQSATELYQTLKSVDSLRANLLFNDLAESLQKSDDRFSSISRTMGTIADLENQIKSARGGNTAELEKQLSLAQEIARVQAVDPSSYDFMGRSLPDAFKGPQNYWDSIGKMFKAINTSAQDGYMGVQDFYNIVNEMNNLAALGTNIDFMGHTLNGSLKSAASLIEAGFGALTNIDGEGVKIDLSRFGVDFASGADQMNANIEDGIHAMADSQIKMLDAMIQLLETIVAMEELGDIDVDSDGLLNFDEFVDTTTDIPLFTEKYQKWRDSILQATNPNDIEHYNEDIANALNSVKINNESLKDIVSKSAKDFTQTDAQILNALYQAAKSNNWDLDNIAASIKEVLLSSGLEGTIEVGDMKFAIKYGQVFEINPDNKVLDNNGKTHNTVEEAALENAKGLISGSKEKIENAVTSKYDEAGNIVVTFKINEDVNLEVVQTPSGETTYKINGKNYPSQSAALFAYYQSLSSEEQNKYSSYQDFILSITGEIIPEITVANENELKGATQDKINELAQALISGTTDQVKTAAATVGIAIDVEGELTAEQRKQIAELAGIENKNVALNITANYANSEAEALGKLLENDNATIEAKVIITDVEDSSGKLSVNENGKVTVTDLSASGIGNLSLTDCTFSVIDGNAKIISSSGVELATIPLENLIGEGTGSLTLDNCTLTFTETGTAVVKKGDQIITEIPVDTLTGTGTGTLESGNCSLTFTESGEVQIKQGETVSKLIPISDLTGEGTGDLPSGNCSLKYVPGSGEIQIEFPNGDHLEIPLKNTTGTGDLFSNACTISYLENGDAVIKQGDETVATITLHDLKAAGVGDLPSGACTFTYNEKDGTVTVNFPNGSFTVPSEAIKAVGTLPGSGCFFKYNGSKITLYDKDGNPLAQTSVDLTNVLAKGIVSQLGMTLGEGSKATLDEETGVVSISNVIDAEGNAGTLTITPGEEGVYSGELAGGSVDVGNVGTVNGTSNKANITATNYTIDFKSKDGKVSKTLKVPCSADITATLAGYGAGLNKENDGSVSLLDQIFAFVTASLAEGTVEQLKQDIGEIPVTVSLKLEKNLSLFEQAAKESNAKVTLQLNGEEAKKELNNFVKEYEDSFETSGVDAEGLDKFVFQARQKFSEIPEDLEALFDNVYWELENKHPETDFQSVWKEFIDNFKSYMGENSEGLSIKATIDVDENNLSLIQQKLQQVSEDNLNFQFGDAGVELIISTDEAQDQIEETKAEAEKPVTTKIEGDSKPLETSADEGKRYVVSLKPVMKISGDASSAISEAQSAVAQINDMLAQIQIDANVNVQQTTTTLGAGGEASGGVRATGNVALAKGTKTLMGELGPELYVTNGHYYVAGQSGAEFVDLPSDAIVFNHIQTRRLLENGSAGRGHAVTNEHKATSLATGNASGPAMASASAALAALKQIRAMWDAMRNASISDLGSKAGLGKKAGGGGSKDKGQTVKLDSGYIRDLERWYNLLRQIDRLEQDINYEEKLRSKLQADTVANGELIYESQRRTYEMLQRELDDRVELASLKKGYYEQRMAEIQAGPWGQLFYFNEEGVPQMKNLQFLADVFASSEEGGAVHNAREQYAMLQQAGFGSLLQYKEDGSVIEWTDDEGKPREEAYKEAVEAFSAKLDAQTEEVNSLREDYIEEMGNILDLQTKQNEILTQIRENTIAVEEEVLKAIEDFREREIDELQKQRDALSDSADKFIDGLTDSLNKEREMYNSQQEDTELLQMRRQLAILQRSGGSASQIRSLQEQIRQREQEAYFNEQENQINAIKEASDLQLERLDAQISLMQETLEYQKAHGLLWDQVHEIMQGTHEEITQFVTGNNSEWWAKSAAQTQNDLVELDNKIGQWVAHRDDISALGETMKNAINNGIAAITSVVAQVSASQQYTVSGTGSYTIPSGSSSSGGGSSGSSGNSGKKNSKSASDAKKNSISNALTSGIISGTAITANAIKDTAGHGYSYVIGGKTVSGSGYSSAERAAQAGGSRLAQDELAQKKKATNFTYYKEGGLIDFTGPAWVDGTKKKPEGMLNAEQLDMLRNSVLTRKNPIAALLADYGNTVSDTANANTYNSIDRGGDTVIENAQVVMNVSKMSNDYDAKRAGKTALEEMLRISRKTKPTSVSRR